METVEFIAGGGKDATMRKAFLAYASGVAIAR
jgi:hypothetical protein